MWIILVLDDKASQAKSITETLNFLLGDSIPVEHGNYQYNENACFAIEIAETAFNKDARYVNADSIIEKERTHFAFVDLSLDKDNEELIRGETFYPRNMGWGFVLKYEEYSYPYHYFVLTNNLNDTTWDSIEELKENPKTSFFVKSNFSNLTNFNNATHVKKVVGTWNKFIAKAFQEAALKILKAASKNEKKNIQSKILNLQPCSIININGEKWKIETLLVGWRDPESKQLTKPISNILIKAFQPNLLEAIGKCFDVFGIKQLTHSTHKGYFLTEKNELKQEVERQFDEFQVTWESIGDFMKKNTSLNKFYSEFDNGLKRFKQLVSDYVNTSEESNDIKEVRNIICGNNLLMSERSGLIKKTNNNSLHTFFQRQVWKQKLMQEQKAGFQSKDLNLDENNLELEFANSINNYDEKTFSTHLDLTIVLESVFLTFCKRLIKYRVKKIDWFTLSFDVDNEEHPKINYKSSDSNCYVRKRKECLLIFRHEKKGSTLDGLHLNLDEKEKIPEWITFSQSLLPVFGDLFIFSRKDSNDLFNLWDCTKSIEKLSSKSFLLKRERLSKILDDDKKYTDYYIFIFPYYYQEASIN